MNKKLWSVGMIIPMAAAAVVSTAPAATAVVIPPRPVVRDQGVARAIGFCTGRSNMTLTARTTVRNQIAVDVKVTSNRAFQRWNVRITQNGAPILATTALTRPDRFGFGLPLARRTASFTVRDNALNRLGVDRFAVRASNVSTGETCTAQVSLRRFGEFPPRPGLPPRPGFPPRPVRP
jgi:hypothetical protein